MRAYLSHPKKRQEYGLELEEKLFKRGFDVYNPFKESKRRRLKRNKAVVENDLQLIRDSDIVVAYLPFDSCGTAMEILFGFTEKKPVYTLTSKKLAEHFWVSYLSTKVFTIEKELLSYLDTYGGAKKNVKRYKKKPEENP